MKRIQPLLSKLHSQAPNFSSILVGTKADREVCTEYTLPRVREQIKHLIQKASKKHKHFLGDSKIDCIVCYPELFKYTETDT